VDLSCCFGPFLVIASHKPLLMTKIPLKTRLDKTPNFEVAGNPPIGLSGIPILSQFPLEFYYYRETGIKDYQDNFEKKVRLTIMSLPACGWAKLIPF
jgi:hypothetical protein